MTQIAQDRRGGASPWCELAGELPHLRRYARALMRDADAAEDLVQDCLLRAIERQRQFRTGTHFRRWLFTILRNRSIDIRRRDMRRGPVVPLSEIRVEPGISGGQEGWIEFLDLAARLDALRSTDRQVVVLSAVDGLDHATIADRMGVAVGTIKSRLSRARAALAH